MRCSRCIRSAVQAATRIFEKEGVPEPKASAEYLAAKAFGAVHDRNTAALVTGRPSTLEIDEYISLCQQREKARVPIQYLVGDWDFHNITLLVRAPVLIPRPETEELVEHVLEDVTVNNARILDVGCGSGAIMLAALSARKRWTAVGVDTAAEAVKLSNENIKNLKMEGRAKVFMGRLHEVPGSEKFDALVSNPPYIPAKDMKDLDVQVRDHEDNGALCGGADGLDVVREILRHASKVVKPGGSVWLEVDPSHPVQLQTMAFDGLEFETALKDLFGRPRFVHLRVSE